MPAPSHSPRVLLVDDDASVRAVAERVLQDTGYEVVAVANGSAAIERFEQPDPFDLCVVDIVMPQMSGIELAARLRRADPDVKVLYFTGYSDRLFHEKKLLWANEAFIDKPVSIDGLREAVSLLLFGHTSGPPPRQQ